MRGYIIKDWAGNILHYTGRFERPEFAVALMFESVDDAWVYAMENMEASLEDLYVMEGGAK